MESIALDAMPAKSNGELRTSLTPAATLNHHDVSGRPETPADMTMSRSGSRSGLVAATSTDEHERMQEEQARALPPVDGGRGAWTFAACAWALEFFMWGSTFSLGVFQAYYIEEFKGEASAVSVSAIGTTLAAFGYLSGPLSTPLFRQYEQYSKHIAFGGLMVGILSLFASSFVSGVPGLIALQGVGAGLGSGIAFAPVLLLLPQWWIDKRGLASGIIFSGSTLGGIVLPFLFKTSLEKVGWRWSLRLYTLLFVCCIPAVLFMSPRLPVQRNSAARSQGLLKQLRSQGLGFMASPIYLLNAATIFILSAGYLSVSLYISVYIGSAGYSATIATAGLAILNAAAAIGQFIIGNLCDRYSYTGITVATAGLAILNAAAAIGQFIIGNLCDRYSYTGITVAIGAVSSLSALLLFGLSTSIAAIVSFIILFGVTSGGYTSVWAASGSDVARIRNTQTGSVLVSYGAVKGVASLIGPLIAAALLEQEQGKAGDAIPGKAVFGSYGYATLIIWVGSCMAATAALGGSVHVLRTKILRDMDPSNLQERF